jgi:WD40 repeat protein
MIGIGNDENEGNFILASASADCSVKLWRVRRTNSSSHFRFRPPTDLVAELEHDSSVVSLDFHPYEFLQNFAIFTSQLGI